MPASSTEIGRAHVTITADQAPLDAGLASAFSSVENWASSITAGILQGVGQQLFRSITDGLRAAVGVIQQSVQDASDLTVSINKVGLAFANSADEIIAWSQNSATALGQSQAQALDAASTFGLLFHAIGVGSEQSAAMSENLVQLAADLASINKVDPSVALEKLQAGLVGQIRPLREWGVFLEDDKVKQEAVALGLATTTDTVSDQAKVLARYQIILDQTALQQGNFGRTSGQLAGAQKILAAQIASASATLGQVFLPVQLAFTRGLSSLIEAVLPYGLKIMDSLAEGLAEGIIAILPILAQLRALFTYWLKPGSPPKLLPDLDEWGKETMQLYLDSWGDADFNSLKALGGTIEDILRSFVSSGQISDTDLVSSIFGGRKAIEDAVDEFRRLGSVSTDTLSRIAQAAGPAGDKVQELVRQYFELQKAAQGVTDAQNNLNNVTRKYSDALDPINKQLDEVRQKQQDIQDQQDLAAQGKILLDPNATVDDKQLARLKIQQIELEHQANAIGAERDVAVKAAQDKVDAAKKEQDAQQAKLNAAQDILDQQVKTNQLIGEEIDLRKKVANEADASAKKILADQQAIHQAQLNYNLALTDTAGQIAILQGELANTTPGTAAYFDLLTRIVNLQQQLAATPPPSMPLLGGGKQPDIPIPAGIQKLGEAIDQAFKALTGGDQKEVKLNPAFQSFADTIGTIKQVVLDAMPAIQAIIDLIMGKGDGKALDTKSDPFSDNWWLKGWIPGINSIISELQKIRKGDWAGVWHDLQQVVTDFATLQFDDDPKKFSFWVYLNDNVIPALQLLAAGDWKDAIALFAKPLADLVINAYNAGHDLMGSWWGGIKAWFTENGDKLKSWWDEQLHKFVPNSMLPGSPAAPPSSSGGGQDVPMPSPFASFSGGSIGAPVLAAAAGGGGNSGMVVYQTVNQTIGTGGDFGGARAGAADGIRQALIAGKLT